MEHVFTTTRHARYHQLGEWSSTTKEVWIVFHGYGQLAQFFIKKFQLLADAGQVVIAPEGLHRFYTQGQSGRVGASWMSKEWREKDIEDNLSMLHTLYEITRPNIHSGVKINVIGFSQGAATSVRWLAEGKVPFAHYIIWAGHLPPDLNYTLASQSFLGGKTTLIMGNQDEYFPAGDYSAWSRLLDPAGIPFNVLTYEGGHDIHTETLRSLIDFN